MYVQPFEGALAQSPFPPLGEPGEGLGSPLPAGGPLGGLGNDGISRLLPPFYGGMGAPGSLASGMLGPLGGLMQQLMQMLQALMGGYGSSPFSGGCPQPPGGEQFFSSANGASQGDPHLSFNGNTWTSMASQPDLLESNSVPGGFRVSTQVTPPNANGVTWNHSATITLDGGATSVSMNNAGQPSIERFGQPVSIAAGQTLQLGNGATVTSNANGSLTVNVENGTGGSIATTLAAKGHGVDVTANAQNVDLGGALVAGTGGAGPQPFAPPPLPLVGPFPFPQPPLPDRAPAPGI